MQSITVTDTNLTTQSHFITLIKVEFLYLFHLYVLLQKVSEAMCKIVVFKFIHAP